MQLLDNIHFGVIRKSTSRYREPRFSLTTVIPQKYDTNTDTHKFLPVPRILDPAKCGEKRDARQCHNFALTAPWL